MNPIGKETKMYRMLYEIDRHGIMTAQQLFSRIKTSRSNIGRGVKKLEKLGFIKVSKVYREYCYYITNEGSHYIGRINFGYTQTDKEPNTTTLRHNLKLVDATAMSLAKLKKEVPTKNLELITEREHLAWWYERLEQQFTGKFLRQEKNGLRKKVPDYLIRYMDDDGELMTLAYELELTRKSTNYLLKKLKWYSDQVDRFDRYQNLIYVCEEKRIYVNVAYNAEKIGLSVGYQIFEPLEGEK
ncbi:MarR family transcriptional regulator [Enterococcus faecium]|nr:MarR family transcriptional regulator [Enterococcus faecium]EMF0115776.1 MarR family transcriptional regulator [Enterococcus hirae]